MGSSMVPASTHPLAPTRFLRKNATKAWVGYLSESGVGAKRRMMGRADTTMGSEIRAYTPNTIRRNRRQPTMGEGAPKLASPKREIKLLPPKNPLRQQLRGSLSKYGEELDPHLLAMMLKQPAGDLKDGEMPVSRRLLPVSSIAL